jgi:hypothetical protein
MSTSPTATPIVIVLQPEGESETADLLQRLGELVALEPSVASAGVQELLDDEELKRCMWATCEIGDLRSAAALDQLAATIDKMIVLHANRPGRLRAMILIDDGEHDDEAAHPVVN